MHRFRHRPDSKWQAAERSTPSPPLTFQPWVTVPGLMKPRRRLHQRRRPDLKLPGTLVLEEQRLDSAPSSSAASSPGLPSRDVVPSRQRPQLRSRQRNAWLSAAIISAPHHLDSSQRTGGLRQLLHLPTNSRRPTSTNSARTPWCLGALSVGTLGTPARAAPTAYSLLFKAMRPVIHPAGRILSTYAWQRRKH